MNLPMQTRHSTGWSDMDRRTTSVIRGLVADVTELAGGHPGTAISLAPAAFLLFHKLLRHDPNTPRWFGRDRFVLSVGHSSLTLYLQLFLAGYPMSLDALKKSRTLDSKAHGHPEYDLDEGIEMTTGPLGEGFAASIGMAMAARRFRGLMEPEAAANESVFDHTIWVFASDGDIQEGVVSEAASLAGHQKLGNLVVVWDDNHISADGSTEVSISEDTLAKFQAMGWHVQRVDWVKNGVYDEDVDQLEVAMRVARQDITRPSIIALRTIIAWPAPTRQNTQKAHAAKLGDTEVRNLKTLIGLNPDEQFALPSDVIEHARLSADAGRVHKAEWDSRFEEWSERYPERRALFNRLQNRALPNDLWSSIPEFQPDTALSTRAAVTQVLQKLKQKLPEVWGGGADMNESTGSNMAAEASFLPAHTSTQDYGAAEPYGRNLHFGVREHAMAAALNGIALHGMTRACGGTFLQFAFHMLPSIRLAALMNLPTVYIFTHDSIALGEDGPTHQPIEHLAALRAMPRLDVVRPGDANEARYAWKTIMEKARGPSAFSLSRQALPVYDRPSRGFASAELTALGAYVLAEVPDGLTQDVILIATGSELALAVDARDVLEFQGVGARVVSMPCREWFSAQPIDYRQAVLPPEQRARVSVEAATALGWRDLVGDAGRVVAIDRFGESAPAAVLQQHFGFTVDAVVAAALASIETAQAAPTVPTITR